MAPTISCRAKNRQNGSIFAVYTLMGPGSGGAQGKAELKQKLELLYATYFFALAIT
jgi:hypothetical protein